MSSLVGAVLFFVEKDKTLQLCINYQGFNKITLKNFYPLSLISSAFNLLQRALVTKCYHLVRT